MKILENVSRDKKERVLAVIVWAWEITVSLENQTLFLISFDKHVDGNLFLFVGPPTEPALKNVRIRGEHLTGCSRSSFPACV